MNKCENCGKEHDGFYGSGRFCTSKCARGFSTKAKRSEINEKVSETLKKTHTKGYPFANFSEERRIELHKKQSETLKEYHRKRKEHIKKIVPFEKWSKALIYEFLFEENGHICEKCGYHYVDSKINKGPYEVHHKDGNKKNWKKDNLEILCLICHWKTGNWRFRGKKHTEDAKRRISKNNGSKHSSVAKYG